MKILYAANKSLSSLLQLKRFAVAVSALSDEIRFAGYHRYLHNQPVDYTIDAVHDFYGLQKSHDVTRKSVQRYFDEISDFKPDLIINDCDFVTSYVASELNIPYWLVGGQLLYLSLTQKSKRNIKLANYQFNLVNNYEIIENTTFQLTNASKRLVYSHFGDLDSPPELQPEFEFVRPYYCQSEPLPEQKDFVIASLASDKKLINYLSTVEGSYLFTGHSYEIFSGIEHHDIFFDTYPRYVASCLLHINNGEPSLLADAFYNGKYSLIFPDMQRLDVLTATLMSDWLRTGERLYTLSNYDQLNMLSDKEIQVTPNLNPSIKQLHEIFSS